MLFCARSSCFGLLPGCHPKIMRVVPLPFSKQGFPATNMPLSTNAVPGVWRSRRRGPCGLALCAASRLLPVSNMRLLVGDPEGRSRSSEANHRRQRHHPERFHTLEGELRRRPAHDWNCQLPYRSHSCDPATIPDAVPAVPDLPNRSATARPHKQIRTGRLLSVRFMRRHLSLRQSGCRPPA